MRYPLAILLLASIAMPAESADQKAQQVDAMLRAVTSSQSPGVAVAVVQGDDILLVQTYGMADVDGAQPVTPTTRFRIGSVTKSFTALATLQLVDAGTLKLDDPISKYLPDFPHGHRIRVSHLLSHTAGIADFVPMEQVMRQPLDFEPGARINYTNNGYTLLGQIIEKVSGQPWDAYLRAHIFAPLGMTNTGYDRLATLPGRARGYVAGEPGTYTPITLGSAEGAYAAGGIYSTVQDMALWVKGLNAGALLRPATLAQSETPVTLTDGRRAAYGLGWMTRSIGGLNEAGHGGDIAGFNAYVARYPSERFAVVVLSNTGMRPPGSIPEAGALAHSIAALWLGERVTRQVSRPQVTVAQATLDGYTGRFKLDAPPIIIQNMGSDIVITRDGDRLIAEVNGLKLPLDALSASKFQAAGSPAELTFVCDPGGLCSKIVVTLMGLREYNAFRQ